LQNSYKFRISGTQFTGLTRMVQIDGIVVSGAVAELHQDE
jgi:hypothetical protein